MKNDLINEIFTNKMTVIYGYLLKIGCNKHDAEDIIQDSFYKALTYLDIIETSKISAWLFKVSINKYYDLCRKNNKHIHINIDAPEDNFINMICNARSIEGTYTTPYETLFNKLSKDNKTINKSDIKILGVVVSGDARLVEQLNGLPFIKSSTFGAIVDKY